jgi:hypothetical protein
MYVSLSLYPRSTIGEPVKISVDLKWGTIDFAHGASRVTLWAADYNRPQESKEEALRALVAQLDDAVETAITRAAEASPTEGAPINQGVPSAASEVLSQALRRVATIAGVSGTPSGEA